ncbi:hypothetical protein D7V97_27140 [Corallococcus sp. CA053C]|uniref:hypothetical protein n=1 Tax=Corallococcus sp. CA053C TaxID=2316732 RepID=UPI000EA13E4F|nr:hypothetical protein [Corallococcus sp. CA053C]RKH03022.1 hypothetical protein D7V97_27140 [Corallococcus sp. CA053C]
MPPKKPFSIPIPVADRNRPRFGGPSLKENPQWNPFSVLEDGVEDAEPAPVRAPRTQKTAIHFVWYGTGAPNDANTKSPKSIAASFPGATVYFWCLTQMAPAFEKALGKRVKVHTLNEVLDHSAVRKEVGPLLLDKLDQLLKFYLANRGHAPAKDILTFLTLALNGGYFFDANCVIEVPEQFEKMLASPPKLPTFLKLEDTLCFNPKPPGFMTDDLALQMGMAEEDDDEDDLPSFNGTDMWAMYSPARHPMLWTIACHYIARAEAFGFCGGPRQEGSLRSQMHNSFVEGIAQQKRTLAGALGIQSIFAGMHKHKQRDASYKPEDVNWEVDAVKAGQIEGGGPHLSAASAHADYWVKDLGLTKGHGGSWT